MSKMYSFSRRQIIPSNINTVWDFFSDPNLLASITPAELSFEVRSKKSEKMYAGQLIEYTVRPILGIPLYWMTEITHVVEGQYFVDEQRFGPYQFWHHQHHFKQVPDGVEMTDIVHYKVPFWFVGDLANSLIVKQKLKRIFDFRLTAVENYFKK